MKKYYGIILFLSTLVLVLTWEPKRASTQCMQCSRHPDESYSCQAVPCPEPVEEEESEGEPAAESDDEDGTSPPPINDMYWREGEIEVVEEGLPGEGEAGPPTEEGTGEESGGTGQIDWSAAPDNSQAGYDALNEWYHRIGATTDAPTVEGGEGGGAAGESESITGYYDEDGQWVDQLLEDEIGAGEGEGGGSDGGVQGNADAIAQAQEDARGSRVEGAPYQPIEVENISVGDIGDANEMELGNEELRELDSNSELNVLAYDIGSENLPLPPDGIGALDAAVAPAVVSAKNDTQVEDRAKGEPIDVRAGEFTNDLFLVNSRDDLLGEISIFAHHRGGLLKGTPQRLGFGTTHTFAEQIIEQEKEGVHRIIYQQGDGSLITFAPEPNTVDDLTTGLPDEVPTVGISCHNAEGPAVLTGPWSEPEIYFAKGSPVILEKRRANVAVKLVGKPCRGVTFKFQYILKFPDGERRHFEGMVQEGKHFLEIQNCGVSEKIPFFPNMNIPTGIYEKVCRGARWESDWGCYHLEDLSVCEGSWQDALNQFSMNEEREGWIAGYKPAHCSQDEEGEAYKVLRESEDFLPLNMILLRDRYKLIPEGRDGFLPYGDEASSAIYDSAANSISQGDGELYIYPSWRLRGAIREVEHPFQSKTIEYKSERSYPQFDTPNGEPETSCGLGREFRMNDWKNLYIYQEINERFFNAESARCGRHSLCRSDVRVSRQQKYVTHEYEDAYLLQWLPSGVVAPLKTIFHPQFGLLDIEYVKTLEDAEQLFDFETYIEAEQRWSSCNTFCAEGEMSCESEDFCTCEREDQECETGTNGGEYTFSNPRRIKTTLPKYLKMRVKRGETILATFFYKYQLMSDSRLKDELAIGDRFLDKEMRNTDGLNSAYLPKREAFYSVPVLQWVTGLDNRERYEWDVPDAGIKAGDVKAGQPDLPKTELRYAAPSREGDCSIDTINSFDVFSSPVDSSSGFQNCGDLPEGISKSSGEGIYNGPLYLKKIDYGFESPFEWGYQYALEGAPPQHVRDIVRLKELQKIFEGDESIVTVLHNDQDDQGRTVSHQLGESGAILYNYNTPGETVVTTRAGTRIHYQFNDAGLLTQRFSEGEFGVHYEYQPAESDAFPGWGAGRLESLNLPDGQRIEYDYQGGGGNISIYLPHVIRHVGVGGSPVQTTTLSYTNPQGEITSRIKTKTVPALGGNNETSMFTYTYDFEEPALAPCRIQGNLVRLDYPDGSFEAWTYNKQGKPLEYRHRNGRVDRFDYGAYNDADLDCAVYGILRGYQK